MMQDFRNLNVWQKAHALTLAVYRATSSFPYEERFGLTSQLRRSCASVPANLAEGTGRTRDTEFAQFVNVAMGSACETDYHLLLSRDLVYLSDSTYQTLVVQVREVKRMLWSFEQTLRGNR
jgi:four helix bundle protein